MSEDGSWEDRRERLKDRRAARKADAVADLEDMIVANWPTAEEKRKGADRRAADRRAGRDRRIAQIPPGDDWDGQDRREGPRRNDSVDRRLGPRRSEGPTEPAPVQAYQEPLGLPDPPAQTDIPAPESEAGSAEAIVSGQNLAISQFVQKADPAAEPEIEEPVLQEEVPVPPEAPEVPDIPWEERVDPITGKAFPPYRD